jgi:hypothetical protein
VEALQAQATKLEQQLVQKNVPTFDLVTLQLKKEQTTLKKQQHQIT